jgi:glycosyltransferase involved in cell wall biosynthesis
MQELKTEKLQPIELPQLPDNPLVSVLIANYNYAKYVGEAIESALKQTYSNLEIIVCDDGSKDNSCEVIETYVQKDSRVKLIRKQNGGVSSALNATYQESKGQIICFLDADDIWMKDKLQVMIAAFRSNSKVGFGIHNIVKIDGEGKLIKLAPMFSNLPSGWLGPFALENGGFVYNAPLGSALCMRREIADLMLPLDEAFVRNVDSLICFKAVFITEIVGVPEVYSMYRVHGANLTVASSLTPNYLEREINVFKRIHNEQKQFLKNFYGDKVADQLRDLDCSVTYLHYRYILTHLQHKSRLETKEAHRQLVNHPQFNLIGSHQWLLIWGEHLPKFLFMGLFDIVYGSSWLKRLARLLVKRNLAPSHAYR